MAPAADPASRARRGPGPTGRARRSDGTEPSTRGGSSVTGRRTLAGTTSSPGTWTVIVPSKPLPSARRHEISPAVSIAGGASTATRSPGSRGSVRAPSSEVRTRSVAPSATSRCSRLPVTINRRPESRPCTTPSSSIRSPVTGERSGLRASASSSLSTNTSVSRRPNHVKCSRTSRVRRVVLALRVKRVWEPATASTTW